MRDTPQPLGAAERLNRTLDEEITTLLSQSDLSRIWWEDAAPAHSLWKDQVPFDRNRPQHTI